MNAFEDSSLKAFFRVNQAKASLKDMLPPFEEVLRRRPWTSKRSSCVTAAAWPSCRGMSLKNFATTFLCGADAVKTFLTAPCVCRTIIHVLFRIFPQYFDSCDSEMIVPSFRTRILASGNSFFFFRVLAPDWDNPVAARIFYGRLHQSNLV